ncbi:MAG: DUF883 domain-containing protein [Proteobacteria bacterium]|nr:DUF883 domain-containing protein [Pseudomonadota bacterium]
MNVENSEPIRQLHKVLAELEGLARSTAEKAGEGGTDLIGQLKEALATARSRLADAERTLRRDATEGVKSADQYVHDHTWMSIGIAAAVAFLLGALTARRD